MWMLCIVIQYRLSLQCVKIEVVVDITMSIELYFDGKIMLRFWSVFNEHCYYFCGPCDEKSYLQHGFCTTQNIIHSIIATHKQNSDFVWIDIPYTWNKHEQCYIPFSNKMAF